MFDRFFEGLGEIEKWCGTWGEHEYSLRIHTISPKD